ncbi:DotH/IcmK family type IV secretion protein [Rugamonas apoptosis]|uniref:Conjugal transfer protein TraN n=1 Tax=Rugamonas apoptosis TaxID=2758570 RepID=A0A7W2INF5_9BURK|nr:DotH/IcmK family type IV secretion protein [Rugamonas apoptosis]MBA5690556.1 conjugal transfer protein TraN [Rugamonas apoptosis]
MNRTLTLALVCLCAAGTAQATQPESPSAKATAVANQFPPPPAPPTAGTAGAQSAAPVQATAYGNNGGGPSAATASGPSAPAENGVAPLPPLSPPTSAKQAENILVPLAPDEIIKLRIMLENMRKANAYHPVRTVPKTRDTTADLSPGAPIPIARMLPGEMSTLVFIDGLGNPWPLAAPPRVSDQRSFDVDWLKDSASVVISPLSSYEDGNLAVILRGLATPIMIKLVTGEPDSNNKSREVDYRLDIRVPGRAPGAPTGVAGPERVALYDTVLQGFLDGLPPKEAHELKVRGGAPTRTQVWQLDGAVYVRTAADFQSAFEQTMAASDGTRVYRLAPTPYVTLSEGGQPLVLELDIE